MYPFFYNLLLIIIGVALLTKGADWLIGGSAGIAKRYGVSSMIVGLTLVAFGTSAPELAASLASALHGKGDIAFGNVVGSNICNIGLILGTTALLKPIPVSRNTIKWEIPFMIIASALLYLFAWHLRIERWMGIIFLGGFLVFVLYCTKNAKKPGFDPPAIKESLVKMLILILVGGTGLAVGAEIFLRGVVNIARILGISEAVISLTLVALGTSLPELSASLMATWKGESSIALGNVIGSNIFNILLVAGMTASISPFQISRDFLLIGLPAMILVSLAIVPFSWFGKGINRIEGVVLVLFYFGYVAWLFL